MKNPPPPKDVLGQKSWRLRSDCVQACLTRRGGQLGPVTFDRIERKIQPYSVAPWAEEKLGKEHPPIIRALRGDFFCLPFGGNDTPYRGEQHPVHGETANERWKLKELVTENNEANLKASLKTRIRPGKVDKHIRLVFGHNAIYSRHRISDMKGPMPLGHHAMLKFPDKPESGLIATSPLIHRQVFVEPTEDPAERGYSMLKPGAEFNKLESVPTITPKHTDLSRYPARRGFEDIVILVNDPSLPLAWTAVTFPEQGYLWFSLKDPNVLASTLLWLSNGGRHYPPWNGRHINVMGLEEITGFFHYGLAESARKNELSERGIKTCHKLKPDESLTVNYIMGVALIPDGFTRVKEIEPVNDGQELAITSVEGKTVVVPLDTAFLQGTE